MHHGVLILAVLAGIGVRVLAMVAYQPALWYNDSFEYVGGARRLQPYLIRPSGYSFLLRALEPFHSFALVVAVQHALGVALGVLIYIALLRLGVRRWIATLAAVPVLLDPDLVQLEHLVLSDTVFTFLLALAVVLLLWSPRPSKKACAAAGLLLAGAALTRSIGLPFVVLAAAYVLVRRGGWRGLTLLLVTFAIPVAAYASWFDHVNGRFALTNSNGIFLYSRVTTFADCDKIKPPADEQALCLTTPLADRGPTEAYIWHVDSPLYALPDAVFSARTNALAGDFAHRAILAQPVDYLRAVKVDVFRGLAWHRVLFPNKEGAFFYVFHQSGVKITGQTYGVVGGSAAADTRWYQHGEPGTKINHRVATWLSDYQRAASLRGALIGGLLAIGAIGLLARRRRPTLFLPLLLVEATAVALWIIPPATAEFDWRFVLPVVPFASFAAALAIDRLFARPERGRPDRVRPNRIRPAGPPLNLPGFPAHSATSPESRAHTVKQESR